VTSVGERLRPTLQTRSPARWGLLTPGLGGRGATRWLDLSVAGCGEDELDVPGGGSPGDTGGGSGNDDVGCPNDWEEQTGSVWLQPEACLAWSPRSDQEMDWYQAVSPEEATAGGCSAHCDEDEGYCPQLGTLGGVSGWRLPSYDELDEAAKAYPPMENAEGYLWSRDSDSVMEQMAWQLDLSIPGGHFLAEKEADGWVRCVADL